jgi:hypothetical protein
MLPNAESDDRVGGFSQANLMYMRAFAEAWPESLQANLPTIEQIERELAGGQT